LFRRSPHHIENDFAFFVTCRDIKEYKFIGSLFLVSSSHFDRIARVSEVDKIGAFDDTPVVDIKAGNDSCG
jgi:tRNA (Thr-GGU) A37 N-methylase